MRCGRCGNENAEDNRFCGMCGASLVAKPQPSAPAPAAPTPQERKVEPAPLRPSAEARIPRVPVSSRGETAPPLTEERVVPPVDTRPIITGPSFLGLNKPGDGRGAELQSRHEHGRGHDSWDRPSRSADYLLEDLEDDEEPKRGWGKFLMVILALVLAGGFGYLRWKQGGFDWLLNEKKAAPAAAESSQNAASPGSTPSANANPETASPSPTNPNPAAPGPTAGGAAAAPAASGTPASGADTSAQTGTPPTSTPPDTAAASSATAQNAPPASVSPEGSATPAANSAPTSPAPAADAEAPASKPKADVSGKASLRERKPTPVTPVDPTAEAERYIYGSGVRQDCDRGLRLLKPAAEQSNVKAMISMGVLYSTGTCTPRDLPTAYRWFALALHKQPDNVALQDDLQKLWSQMTQPERQLAIKLSQ